MSKFSDESASVAAMLSETFKNDKVTSVATDDLKADLKDAISTGIPPLDARLGGGIFKGRIYEFFGEESHGKSTLSYNCAGAFQAANPKHVVHILETESAIDKIRCQAIGMDISRLVISECDLVTEGFARIKEIDELMKKKLGPDCVVLHIWDTIAAASTAAEKEGNQYGGGISEKARLIRSALRDITGILSRSGSILFLINQVYDMIGSYGGGVTSPGGRGIRHHASVRIHVIKKTAITEQIDGKDKVIGYFVDMKFIKNKIAVPMTSFQAKMHTSYGFLPTPSLCHDVLNELKPTEIEFAGGGWTTLHFPPECAEGAAQKMVKAQGAGALEKVIKPSKFLRKYMEYLCYKRYTDFYPLMLLKYRHLLWQKQQDYREAWNAECAKYKGQLIDLKKYPAPAEVTVEELRKLNDELERLDANLEGTVEKDPMMVD